MPKILSQRFFKRPTEIVAKNLLGKFLIRKIGGKEIAVKITELEIYDGFNDLASHASHGKTKRNEIMFEDGGYFYVYLVYGMHWMINIVTSEKGYPSAILLRCGEVSPKLQTTDYKLSADLNGPGKLSKFLKVDKSFNGKMAAPENELWFEDRGVKIENFRKTPRIGIHYAGLVWSKKKWRFVV